MVAVRVPSVTGTIANSGAPATRDIADPLCGTAIEKLTRAPSLDGPLVSSPHAAANGSIAARAVHRIHLLRIVILHPA